jgi:hypothetical protein
VKNDAGEKFATSWLKDHPRDLSFRHFLGEQSIAKKDYALAIKQYSTIIEMEPNDVPALNNLAWVSGQQKDPKAVTYAERRLCDCSRQRCHRRHLWHVLMDRGEVARGCRTSAEMRLR